ncbi:ComEC/Rec2 family competence protein [Pseudomonas nitroreducens]|uniref:ComEC/Rec2 family competence protein n=1 Tax=Pseudomonas nitroreducens TaxID=46680 RepID=UPI0020A013A9|nr:MBL fold metallo-hydrolase [Pseudomonas nitroreducens]MCP1623622.1 beta-lactamase superfamily II metal-dependent hydrolase [Pseudomonas nitroreducens]
MPMSIKFIRADHGDSILIQIKNRESTFTILIDGGPATAFRNNSARRDGCLKLELEKLREANTPIDLLVLTHIDSDHIGGLLEGFKDPTLLPSLVKKVWFNSAASIFKSRSLEVKSEHYISEDFSASLKTSIKEGMTFEGLIKKHNIWDEELVDTNYRPFLPDGIDIKILSPDTAGLDRLLQKWKPYSSDADLRTAGCAHDYNEPYSKLLELDSFKEDGSRPNGSSISLLLEVEGCSILLLADSHPSTIVSSLKELGYSDLNPLQCELIKLSHHGSKKNTSPELLRIVRSPRFVVTTDGSYHCLPNKMTFARIHQIHPHSQVLFNYPELIEKIYSPNEVSDLGELLGSIEEALQIGR